MNSIVGLSLFRNSFLLSRGLLLGLSGIAAMHAAEPKHFVISDFGAVADGKTINTVAIQKAIDEAAAAGRLRARRAGLGRWRSP